MKTANDIVDLLTEFFEDDRVFNKDGSYIEAATIDVNAPLAMIQLEIKAQVRILQWVLNND